MALRLTWILQGLTREYMIGAGSGTSRRPPLPGLPGPPRADGDDAETESTMKYDTMSIWT